MANINLNPPKITSEESIYLAEFFGSTPIMGGSVPINQLSGELKDPILGNSEGNIFFSPSFNTPNTNNSIYVESIEEICDAGDSYVGLTKTPPINSRPFVFGPYVSSGRIYPPDFSVDYVPSFNNVFDFMGTRENNAKGVFVDLMTMEETIIFY